MPVIYSSSIAKEDAALNGTSSIICLRQWLIPAWNLGSTTCKSISDPHPLDATVQQSTSHTANGGAFTLVFLIIIKYQKILSEIFCTGSWITATGKCLRHGQQSIPAKRVLASCRADSRVHNIINSLFLSLIINTSRIQQQFQFSFLLRSVASTTQILN